MKVGDIHTPAVGKHVRVKKADGGFAAGQVAWSRDREWRLAGSRYVYRYDKGDRLVWYSSGHPRARPVVGDPVADDRVWPERKTLLQRLKGLVTRAQ